MWIQTLHGGGGWYGVWRKVCKCSHAQSNNFMPMSLLVPAHWVNERQDFCTTPLTPLILYMHFVNQTLFVSEQG